MRARLTVYLAAEQQRQIANLAIRRKLSQSALVEAAIVAFLAPEGTERFEAASLALHLETMERSLRRLERFVVITAETVALFVRFWLTVTPSLPADARSAAHAKGRARYQEFVEALGRRLDRGQTLMNDIREDLERNQQAAAAAPSEPQPSEPQPQDHPQPQDPAARLAPGDDATMIPPKPRPAAAGRRPGARHNDRRFRSDG